MPSDSTALSEIQALLNEWRQDGQTGSITTHFDGHKIAKVELHYYLKLNKLDY